MPRTPYFEDVASVHSGGLSVDGSVSEGPFDPEIPEQESDSSAADSDSTYRANKSRKRKRKRSPQTQNTDTPNTQSHDEAGPSTVSETVDTAKEPKTKKKKGPTFQCDECGKILASKTSLGHHVANKVCEKQRERAAGLTCPVCAISLPPAKMQRHQAANQCWRTWDSENPDSVPPPLYPTTSAGPTEDFSNLDAAELYLRFLDDENESVLDQWIFHTNRRGRELKATTERFVAWRDLDKPLALRWLAIHHLLGLRNPRRRTDLWSKSDLYNSQFAINTMSHREYRRILIASRFVDNKKEMAVGGAGHRKSEHYTRLWKIKPILDMFARVSQKLFNADREIVIDEMMVKFKGHFKYIQVMPKKPIKRGIKLWILADARTGYLFNVDVMVKQDYKTTHLKGKTASLVWALLTSENLGTGVNFLNKGHVLYLDSYYTMLTQTEDLLELGTYVSGSIAKARFLPDCMKRMINPKTGKRLEKGEYFFIHSNSEIQMTGWVGNGNFRLVSTVPDISEEVLGVRKVLKGCSWDGKDPKRTVFVPKSVINYTQRMNGVDLFDQLLSYNRTTYLRSCRWFMPIWTQVLEMAFVNSYVITKFDKKTGERFTMQQHKDNLVHALVDKAKSLERQSRRGMCTPGKSKSRNSAASTPHVLKRKYKLSDLKSLLYRKEVDSETRMKRLANARRGLFKKKDKKGRRARQHYLVPIPENVRRCCAVHIPRKETQYFCSECKYPMCVYPCFIRMHELKDYLYDDPNIKQRTKYKKKCLL